MFKGHLKCDKDFVKPRITINLLDSFHLDSGSGKMYLDGHRKTKTDLLLSNDCDVGNYLTFVSVTLEDTKREYDYEELLTTTQNGCLSYSFLQYVLHVTKKRKEIKREGKKRKEVSKIKKDSDL